MNAINNETDNTFKQLPNVVLDSNNNGLNKL